MKSIQEIASMVVDHYLNEARFNTAFFPEDDETKFVTDDHKIGLKYALSQWHSGQWSRGYRLMSSKLRDVPLFSTEQINNPENKKAQLWASHYGRLFKSAARSKTGRTRRMRMPV